MDPTIIPPAAMVLGLAAGGIAKGIVDVIRINMHVEQVPSIVWPLIAWLSSTLIVALLMMQQATVWNQQSISMVFLAGIIGAGSAVASTEVQHKSDRSRGARRPKAQAVRPEMP